MEPHKTGALLRLDGHQFCAYVDIYIVGSCWIFQMGDMFDNAMLREPEYWDMAEYEIAIDDAYLNRRCGIIAVEKKRVTVLRPEQ